MLTKHQEKILKTKALTDLTNKEIAFLVGCSTATLECHLKNIFMKLGVKLIQQDDRNHRRKLIEGAYANYIKNKKVVE